MFLVIFIIKKIRKNQKKYSNTDKLDENAKGKGDLYNNVHQIPYKLFDVETDSNVLIGTELWNKIGANEHAYDELIYIYLKK
ncbi:mjaII restriction endonuclease family protein [Clostridioides difficile CD160]|nr:mjaII restriction endonuclease family protein [Clostridioides difficile CD160]